MSQTKSYYVEYFDLKLRHEKNQKNFRRVFQANEVLAKRNARLEKIIQILESELGVSDVTNKHGRLHDVKESNASVETDTFSEHTSVKPLRKITHTEKVYCEVCPNELGRRDIKEGRCTRCKKSLDL